MTDACPVGDADVCPHAIQFQGCLSLIQKDCETMSRVQGEHHKTLFGNGHEGLKTTMTKLNMKSTATLWLFGVFIVALVGNLLYNILGG